MTRHTALLASALFAAACSVSASAAIVGTGGAAIQVGAPATCVFGTFTSGSVWAWDEQQNRGVSGLPCDLTINPSNSGGPTPGAISGIIDSHFIHFNDFTNAVTGSVTFNNPIVGVAYNNNFIDVADPVVGSFGTVYPTGNIWRGINSITPGGSFVAIAGNTITFNLQVVAGAPDFDQIRVYTHPVPTPGSMALLGAGGMLVGARRRRA